MIEKYADNYKQAQDRIAEAMKAGESYVLLPKEGFSDFSWHVTYETLERLREDGFDIDKVWQPFEYHSIEWYD